jgi:hypothetical protein
VNTSDSGNSCFPLVIVLSEPPMKTRFFKPTAGANRFFPLAVVLSEPSVEICFYRWFLKSVISIYFH